VYLVKLALPLPLSNARTSQRSSRPSRCRRRRRRPAHQGRHAWAWRPRRRGRRGRGVTGVGAKQPRPVQRFVLHRIRGCCKPQLTVLASRPRRQSPYRGRDSHPATRRQGRLDLIALLLPVRSKSNLSNFNQRVKLKNALSVLRASGTRLCNRPFA